MFISMHANNDNKQINLLLFIYIILLFSINLFPSFFIIYIFIIIESTLNMLLLFKILYNNS